ncbi:MAG: peptidase, partial [Candidatus Nitrosotenuis sp.]|nr:peptidase [Candidatus Nitrosotenuis sp.]
IKNNAKWWADGTIGDTDFISGIQYLINQKIIKIPPTSAGSGTGSNVIPPWIKNNAKWWADGTIGDTDFISGIQYLITNGIIKIKS